MKAFTTQYTYLLLALIISTYSAYSLKVNYKMVSAPNNQISVFSDNEMIMAGENGKLIRTTDSGKSWLWVETGTRNSFVSMNFNSNGYGVLSTNCELFISRDKGKNWELAARDQTDSIRQSYITENNKTITYSNGKYLINLEINSGKRDTIFSVDDFITCFDVKDSIIYLSSKTNFYSVSGKTQLQKTKLNGKYNLTLNSFALNNNNILIFGTDTSGSNYSEFLYKSSDGGMSFDSIAIKALGYKRKIIYYKDNFIVLGIWGKLFYYDNDFNFKGADTVVLNNYEKYSGEPVIIKDIIPFSDKLYFCGRDQIFGFMKPQGFKKVLNWASVQYPVKLSTVQPTNCIKIDEDLFILANLGKIFKSTDNGISWNTIFPFDTVSDNVNKSPWLDYKGDNVFFYSGFKYKNGYRFVGINKNNRPLDIYIDKLTGTINNINKILAGTMIQKGSDIIYSANGNPLARPLSYSRDSGETFNTVSFPDSMLKAQNKAIQLLNLNKSILPISDTKYMLTQYAFLYTNDTINNPNRDEFELIFYTFDISKAELKLEKIMSLGHDFIIQPELLSEKRILLHSWASNKIAILDSSLNTISTNYLDFYPKGIYCMDNNTWIATAYKDSIFITTNEGKNWEFFNLSNGDTTLYENQSSYFNNVVSMGDNQYILIGTNRIVMLDLENESSMIEEIVYLGSNHFYPNPSSKNITVNFSGKIRIFDQFGNNVCEKESLGTINIDVSNLPNGSYFMLLTDKRQTIMEKMVIAR